MSILEEGTQVRLLEDWELWREDGSHFFSEGTRFTVVGHEIADPSVGIMADTIVLEADDEGLPAARPGTAVENEAWWTLIHPAGEPVIEIVEQ